MHLICFIMAVISTAAPTGAAAAVQLPVTTLRGVISAGASRQVYGGREGGEGGGARHRRCHYGRHSSLISPLADDDDQHTAAHHRR